jgi:glycosyltransferase involved in cell wall biosynthesis
MTPYYYPAIRYGGPARSISTLCKGLAQAGAQVTVFTTNADGDGTVPAPVGTPVELDGTQVYYFPVQKPRGFFRSPAMLEAARRRVSEFDIVHSCGLWTYCMLAAHDVCTAAGMPRIDSPRGGLMPWDLHHRYWKKWLYLKAGGLGQLNSAAAFHCTDEVEAEAVRKLGLKPPAFVIPNAVDAAAFQAMPARGKLKAQLGLPERSSVSLFLGRLSAKKGIALALQAFRAVAGRHKDSVFVIAGPDSDGAGSAARQMASALGLNDRVRFVGEVAGEMRLAALADADLFVLTSHSENFGMAPAEAMAAGVPVLLSDGVGISRSAAAAGAGEVARLEVPEIAAAWTRMLENPAVLRRMGEKGRAFVRREYDPCAVARRMLGVYETVISDWQRARGSRAA